MMLRLDRGCPGVAARGVSVPSRATPPEPTFREDDTGRVEVGEDRPEPERLAGAVLDSLASHIAVLDESGTILAVNESWRQFARANGADDRAVSAGVNYLRICDEARGEGAEVAAAFATGIRDILAGRRATLELEYACHAPNRRHWFVGRVSRLRCDGPPRVVISHEEVTERKRAEDQVRRLNEQLNRRLGRTKALRRIDAAIANSRDRGRALALVVEEAIGQLGVDAADILICDEAAGAMEFATGLGIPPGASGDGATDPGGLVGRVVRVGLPLFVPDLAKAPVDGPRKRRLVAEGFVTYHAIPLMAEGRVKGVLECFRRVAMEPDSEWLAFAAMLAGQAAIAIDNAALFEDLRRSNEELKVAYDSTIEGWARALDLRDRDTEGHSRRVTEMALALARDMGLGEVELVHIRRGALLHDMGKLGVSDAILHKPGPLSEEEWAVMRRHPSYAVEILGPIEFLGPALEIPHYHHERWDGTGYPCGLAGEQIPLAARIFAAVDIWDALSYDRPYRRAWPQARVREHLRSLSGTHLDPRVVDALLGLLAAAEAASPTETAVSSSAAPNSARRFHGTSGPP